MKSFDDRDQPIELFRLPRSQLKQPLHTPMKLSEGQRRRNDRATRVAAIYSGIPILATVALWLFLDFLTGWVKVVVTCIFIVLVILVIRISVRKINRIDAIHWLVSSRKCGACGHSLQGLPTQEDGCWVCPECGAAWQLPTW